MRLILRSLIFGASLLSMRPALAAQGVEYDAVADFSLSSNPNGPWRYLHYGPDSSALFSVPNSSFKQISGLLAWTNGKAGKPAAYIARNGTAKTIRFETIVLPTNELLLNGHSGAAVLVRFSAPRKSVYRIKVEVSGSDKQELSVNFQINAKGKILCSGDITYFGQSFVCRRTITMQKGDFVDLVAGPDNAGVDLHGSLGVTFRIKRISSAS